MDVLCRTHGGLENPPHTAVEVPSLPVRALHFVTQILVGGHPPDHFRSVSGLRSDVPHSTHVLPPFTIESGETIPPHKQKHQRDAGAFCYFAVFLRSCARRDFFREAAFFLIIPSFAALSIAW